MKLVQASEASRLSGLTPHQLREWCGRRGVVTPDVPPAGRGRNALFSWQTILVLRVLNEIHKSFGGEVSAWRDSMNSCQELLKGHPFPSLWGAAFVFENTTNATFLHRLDSLGSNSFLITPLDPHLRALVSDGSAPPEQQFPLFAALAAAR